MSITVYLSPSTQENNLGAGSYGTEEKRMNQIANVTERILNNHGITIYRNKPEWTLKKVVQDSNIINPDLHFAIHSNAGGGRGTEVFAYAAGGEGEKAAKLIYKELEPLTPTVDRGVKFNPSLYELKYTKAPATLLEIAFHDHPEDAVWIINHIEETGIALAKGILKYFNIPYMAPDDEPACSKKYYRVQVGAYLDKANAEAMLKRLKDAGFDGHIKYE